MRHGSEKNFEAPVFPADGRQLRRGADESSGDVKVSMMEPELLLLIVSVAYSGCATVCLINTKSDQFTRGFAHYPRALVVVALAVVYALELGEYLTALDYGPVPPFRSAAAPLASLLALAVAAIIHDRQPPRWMMVEVCFWLASLGCRATTALRLKALPLGWGHARLALAAASCALVALLLAIDLFALILTKNHNNYDVQMKDQSKKKIIYTHSWANAFSQMTFWWLNKLLMLGYKKPLELEDLGNSPDDKTTSVCVENFRILLNAELKESKNMNRAFSLTKCCFRYIYLKYSLGGLFKLMGDCVALVGPLGITVIIEYAKSYHEMSEKQIMRYYPTISQLIANGFVMAIIILVSVIAQGTLSQCSTHIVNVEGIKLKIALQALIYEKCLKLSPWSVNINNDQKQSSLNNFKSEVMDVGAVTNLISEDSYNIMKCTWIGHYVWAIPLKISVIMYLLYLKLGISAIIGAVFCILIMTPLQFIIGKAMSNNSKQCIEYSDQRMMKINEILLGMKFLKIHGLEDIFKEKISATREKELKLLNKDSLYWAIMTFLTHVSSTLITLVTFGLYSVLEEEEMSAGAVFSGLALFNQLTVPLFIFPVIVPIIISAIVSSKRLKDFLMLPEINNPLNEVKSFNDFQNNVNVNIDVRLAKKDSLCSDNILGNIQECEEEYLVENTSKDLSCCKKLKNKIQQENEQKVNNEPCQYAVSIERGQFSWGYDNDEKSFSIFVSSDIKLPKAKITMVIGKTGSGKTSFLSALVGEMNMIAGNIQWESDSSFSYVPQVPWLTNTTIRENIVFGNEAQPRKYKKILGVCCLNTDLSLLPNKDLTEVGEAGGSLSGGQKQRISLARALYSNASVLVLDDPLASLDQTVAQKVFEKGLKKFCLNHKRTVIMTTHNLKLLSYADQIIFINDGVAHSMGSMANVKISDPNLASDWKTLLSQSLNQEKPEKTAKDRWQLVKLVNKFSSHFKAKSDDEAHKVDMQFISLRKRLSTYQGPRFLTHDLFLPTDECEDDLILSSVSKRSSKKEFKTRSLNKHKTAERSTSLQAVKNKWKSTPMKRQSSSPSIQCSLDSNINKSEDFEKNSFRKLFRESPQKNIECRVDGIEIGRQGSKIRRLFSMSTYRKRVSNEIMENEHMPIKRLLSTNSNKSEDYNDEDDLFADSKCLDMPHKEEEREYGKISKQIYLEYFKSCGIVIGTFYLIFTIFWQCMRVYTDIWLSNWTSYNNTNVGSSEVNMTYYVKMYSVFSILSILLSLLSNGLGQYAGALARNILHRKLLENILKSPLYFFQSTPLGRIMNRFSIDTGTIDKKIATSMQILLQFLFLCSSAIIVNAIINPWFLILALPICLFYYLIQRFYRCSARELQRLDATTKSPIFSHFNESLCGITSIRVYKQQERFKTILWNKIDINTNAFIILNSSSCWLGIALDYLGAFIVFVSILISLISIRIYPGTITPSLVGLAINYTLLVPIYLNWVVKFTSDMEMFMSAVERVLQYSTIQSEDFDQIQFCTPNDWLLKGAINFTDVSLRYNSSNEFVLKNINLSIPAGQKLAICGRTGSGKSSLILSLIRMIDICEGSVTVDDVDVKYIPLNELRRKLSVVPQEVVLFGGTIRENLDPNKVHSDDEIWKALELTQLKNTISTFDNGLDNIVREGGVGWNCGAKQLMGITRCILQNSPIILFDEPTAALDHQTEHLLLNALIDLKKNRTIITVAHRLSTIINYDRVIVIDAGRIVEDGAPKDLLLNPTSMFSIMYKAAEEKGV